ncbi:MAG: hypothetical protein ACTSUE_13580 [Promethearchaeota archaeon]
MFSKSIPNEIQAYLESVPRWVKFFKKDSRKILLTCKESFTVYRTLTDILGLPENNSFVIDAKEKLLSDKWVLHLLDELSDWENDLVTGHNKATYLPNQLWLLLDWGVGYNDNERVKNAIDCLLKHQDEETSQFLAFSRVYYRKTKEKGEAWTSALCDHNLIVSVLLLAGLHDDERVKKGLERMGELLEQTSQGLGWKCLPDLVTKRRGPGRKDDACPMLIIDALRGYWTISHNSWPKGLIESGRTLLRCWKVRADEKPYMFGHGRNFRKPRVPFFWYNIGTLLDATSHYPELVKTNEFKELLAVLLLAFNDQGLVIPQTIYKFFKDFSFGQKTEYSPWMTLFLTRIFKRAFTIDNSILDDVVTLDGTSFTGSKG